MRHTLTVRVPSSTGPGWAHVVRYAIPDHMVMAVSIPTDHLVSPGQTQTVHISLDDTMRKPESEPGDALLTRSHGFSDPVCVDRSWDASYIPSNRPLWAIMQDVVDHTAKHPTHGAMCACMDQFSREVRMHLRKAMPPDVRPLPVYDEDCPDPSVCSYHSDRIVLREDQANIHARVMADQRIAHVLGMVMRNF